MKNFTNNFKQFTSRLSARWLIMALMLLVGTSSAWAAYYVAGWNGDWNPTQYNMGGANSYTINNVEAGTYEFKITDGSWNKTWGSGCLSSATGTASKIDNGDCGSNAKIKISTKSNVTIKFTCNNCYDKGGASIQVSATAVQVDPVNVTGYQLAGFNDWSNPITMTKNGDIYTCTKTLTANTYTGGSNEAGFKIIENYSNSTQKWYGNTGTMTRASCSNWTFSEGSNNNCGITADVAGTYTFTFDASTKKLTVTYPTPTYNITYKDQGNVAFSGTHANGHPTTHTYGTATTLKDPTKSGYNFLGWFTTSACNGTKVTSLGATAYTADITLYAKWEKVCTPATSITSATLEDDGTISLAGNFTTCGAKYHGFQWRKSTADWCNDGDETQDFSNYVKIGNTEGSEGEEKVFTPIQGDTYVFRTYIYNNGEWIYSTETIEVSTCVSVVEPAVTMSPANGEVCQDSPITLTLTTRQSGVVYKIGEEEIFNSTTTYSFVPETNPVTVTASHASACAGTNNKTKTFSISIKSLPEAPVFESNSMTVCAGEPFTLPTPTNLKVGTEDCIWSVGGKTTTGSQPGISQKTDYTAVKNDGCSSSAVQFTVNVNPKPTISISDNNSAVLYEDVELTAATDGTSISWEITGGDGSLSSTTGNSVTLTSSSAGNVTVTATATLGSCTATDTHEVEFSAENCADVTTTVEETVGKIKLLLSKPSWIGGSEKFYCYAWVNNTSTTLLGGWPGTELTQKEGDYYYVVVDANNKDIKIILNDNSEQTVDSDVLNANKIYQISATSSKNSDNKYTFNSKTDKGTYKESVTTTVPAPITAPAAKTISVSTTDGEGNIIFSGQVVKTGCDATNEYGFQYSSDQQTWTTVKVGENAAAGTAISNNTVNGLDGPYYVRAYITNDNSTQYGAIKEITVSTKKYPITTVTLTHVKNQAGDSYSAQELANLIYCVGDIVWFKLEQNGSNFQYYEWISYPGTELTGMYDGGMFKFKITESGNVRIRLRNDANVDGEGKPTWIESNLLEFNTHPEPTAPTISFATATICSTNNEGATLTLGATVSGQAYELWKYANDDDTEGSKVANVATLNCTENNQALQFTGIKTAGKYFVKTYYTAFCNTVIANSTHATLTVVNANDVHISISPATATTTPWMPVKLTVAASDDYTLEVPEGVEFNQNGNICSVKIPLPQGSTGGKEQYENVSFPQDATTSYTVTAKLVSTGGEDNPCAVPATATITLTPYEEECTIGH